MCQLMAAMTIFLSIIASIVINFNLLYQLPRMMSRVNGMNTVNICN